MVLDELATRSSSKFSRHKRALAEVVETRISNQRVILVKPLTFMNLSGGAVKALASFYKVDTEHIVALHDELDIDMGAIRAKLGGGDNGHNGLKSMRSSLGTGDWYRIRLGIGRPPGQQDPADYVLKAFASAQKADVADLVDRGADAVEMLVTSDLISVQNRFNS